MRRGADGLFGWGREEMSDYGFSAFRMLEETRSRSTEPGLVFCTQVLAYTPCSFQGGVRVSRSHVTPISIPYSEIFEESFWRSLTNRLLSSATAWVRLSASNWLECFGAY